MIDSSASRNFLLKWFVEIREIATRLKQDWYKLAVVDRSSLPKVDTETIPLPLALQQHYEEITFDIVDIAEHNVVLEMP